METNGVKLRLGFFLELIGMSLFDWGQEIAFIIFQIPFPNCSKDVAVTVIISN